MIRLKCEVPVLQAKNVLNSFKVLYHRETKFIIDSSRTLIENSSRVRRIVRYSIQIIDFIIHTCLLHEESPTSVQTVLGDQARIRDARFPGETVRSRVFAIGHEAGGRERRTPRSFRVRWKVTRGVTEEPMLQERYCRSPTPRRNAGTHNLIHRGATDARCSLVAAATSFLPDPIS